MTIFSEIVGMLTREIKVSLSVIIGFLNGSERTTRSVR